MKGLSKFVKCEGKLFHYWKHVLNLFICYMQNLQFNPGSLLNGKGPKYGIPYRIIQCFINTEQANFILNVWSFIHKNYLAKIAWVGISQLIINEITSTFFFFWLLAFEIFQISLTITENY